MYRNYLAELRHDMELTNEYEEFYEVFERDDLILILSTLQTSLINLFKCMNRQLPTKDNTSYFWADPSRELIDTIEKIETLQRRLKNTKYAFSIDEYYQKIIAKCNTFLKATYGSTIPENMEKIELYYATPIFIKNNAISIKNSNKDTSCNLIPLGEGSYALTFKYKDEFYDKEFVVKRAKKDLSAKELTRFKQEFEIMKQLNSPYILEVFAYDEEKNSYIMEKMDYTLQEYIKLNNDKISLSQRKRLALQLLKACKYLHEKNYLHRDLSPTNVLLKIYDDVIVLKVADFGLAKIPDSTLTTVNTEFKGSFNDPNLKLEGFNNYNIAHEIYALTMLVYFIMTGKTNVSKNDNESLDKIIKKGLNPDKTKRYKNIDELTDDVKILIGL